MSRPDLKSKLYDKLPNVYKNYDGKQLNKFPLKKLIEILGTGFEAMEKSIEGIENIYDLDNCPVEFIPLIVEQMGFKFPYALDDSEHRTLVKAIPKLYQTKGTTKSFSYLAREIFGSSVSINVNKAQYKEGMPVSEWRKIYIELTANTEQLSLDTKEEYFRKFAELVRPVNTTLVIFLSTFFDDVYNSDKIDDYYFHDDVSVMDYDNYDKSKLEDEFSSTATHTSVRCTLDATSFTLDGLFYLDDVQQDGTLAY